MHSCTGTRPAATGGLWLFKGEPIRTPAVIPRSSFPSPRVAFCVDSTAFVNKFVMLAGHVNRAWYCTGWQDAFLHRYRGPPARAGLWYF
jgi:hypothetical protein